MKNGSSSTANNRVELRSAVTKKPPHIMQTASAENVDKQGVNVDLWTSPQNAQT